MKDQKDDRKEKVVEEKANAPEAAGSTRRTFLKSMTIAGIGGVVSMAVPKPAISSGDAYEAAQSATGYVTDPSAQVPVTRQVDVVVVGGGMAGVTAAIAAARHGMKTLIMDYFGCLGGNATSGLVSNFCGLSTSGTGKIRIARGISQEISQALYDKGASTAVNATAFDPELMKVVLDEMTTAANVKKLYYTQMVRPIMEGDTIKGVIVQNKGGRQAILAKRVLDCSGDGDVCAGAGVPYTLGDGKGTFQATDMVFQLTNVSSSFKSSAINATSIAAGIAAGYEITRNTCISVSWTTPGVWWFNWAGVPWQVNATDPKQLTQAAIDGRKVAHELARFLKDRIAGCENAKLIATGSKVGLRESRRVKGLHKMTADELKTATHYPDGVGACAWPFEVVTPTGRTFIYLEGDSFYTIPYRALIPMRVQNLLMAGRFISASHEAQASIRVMGPAMVMGQAIGTAAALSIQRGVAPSVLKVAALQKALQADGAFLE
ncbi:MAG: FAD-dependent oxidoreductase [Syntrophobacter sp.]